MQHHHVDKNKIKSIDMSWCGKFSRKQIFRSVENYSSYKLEIHTNCCDTKVFFEEENMENCNSDEKMLTMKSYSLFMCFIIIIIVNMIVIQHLSITSCVWDNDTCIYLLLLWFSLILCSHNVNFCNKQYVDHHWRWNYDSNCCFWHPLWSIFGLSFLLKFV